MKAIATNKATGERIPVTYTTEHAASSCEQAVWVDGDGNAVCPVTQPNDLYDVENVEVDSRKDLGQYLRYLRLKNGETIRGFAEKCGLVPTTIQNIEGGKFSPRLDVIQKILKQLNATLVIK